MGNSDGHQRAEPLTAYGQKQLALDTNLTNPTAHDLDLGLEVLGSAVLTVRRLITILTHHNRPR